MKASHLRSLVKGITWRVIGTLSTAVITYLVTGKIAVALYVGGFEFFGKILIFYFHERMWENISFGKTAQISEMRSE